MNLDKATMTYVHRPQTPRHLVAHSCTIWVTNPLIYPISWSPFLKECWTDTELYLVAFEGHKAIAEGQELWVCRCEVKEHITTYHFQLPWYRKKYSIGSNPSWFQLAIWRDSVHNGREGAVVGMWHNPSHPICGQEAKQCEFWCSHTLPFPVCSVWTSA